MGFCSEGALRIMVQNMHIVLHPPMLPTRAEQHPPEAIVPVVSSLPPPPQLHSLPHLSLPRGHSSKKKPPRQIPSDAEATLPFAAFSASTLPPTLRATRVAGGPMPMPPPSAVEASDECVGWRARARALGERES